MSAAVRAVTGTEGSTMTSGAPPPGTALVLGGGGLAGIAWETGLLAGLDRLGLRLRAADTLIGTSAGATVAAQVAGPTPLEELVRAQLDGDVAELAGSVGLGTVLALVWAFAGRRDPAPGRRRVGRRAMRSSTPPPEDRRRVIEARLPVHAWPDRDLRLAVVDAISGERRVLDRSSGVDLVDAVAASCAVPLVWPPVPLDGRSYIDGGIPSPTNADLATGFGHVVVLAPQTASPLRGGSVRGLLAELGAGVRTVLVTPDAEARRKIGRHVLDPACRRPAAEAGLAQARRVAGEVATLWQGS